MSTYNFILLVLTANIYLNIATCYNLYYSNSFDERQKKIQYTIVWLIPILGALMVLLFIRSDNEVVVRYENNNKSKVHKILFFVFLAPLLNASFKSEDANGENETGGFDGGDGGGDSG